MNTKLVAWALARLKEPQTWAGLGMIALALGAPPETANALGEIGKALVLILGTGLAAATTSNPEA